MQANDNLESMYSCLSSGDLSGANFQALEILKLDNKSAPAWFVVGEYELSEGNYEAAKTSFSCVTSISPSSAQGWFRLYEVLFAVGDFNAAMDACLRALALDPTTENFAAYFRFPIDEKSGDKREKVLSLLLNALTKDSKSVEHYLLLSRFYVDEQDFDKAANAYLLAVGSDSSDNAMAQSYGRFLYEIGKLEQATKVFLELTEKDPDVALNWILLGGCYFKVGLWDPAIEANRRALDLEPEDDAPRLNLAMAYSQKAQYQQCVELLRPLTQGDHPNFPIGSIQHLGVSTKFRHFDRYLGGLETLDESEARLLQKTEDINQYLSTPVTPFSLLGLVDSPELQLQVAKSSMPPQLIQRIKLEHSPKPDGRIRVGWFGSDFYSHATMHLLSGVFREYDRSKFDFRVYDYGVVHDHVTEKLKSLVDFYCDVSCHEDGYIADLARSHSLDIAVDLKGYTGSTRSTLFSHGLAPVQTFYLGYPGTSGQDFFDYFIADKITIPSELRGHFSEKIMFMPHTYQPNDSERFADWIHTDRRDWGLDPTAVVFASFNQVYKISRHEIAVWSQILKEIAGAQLWFWCTGSSEYHEQIKARISTEFLHNGIREERLVFAATAPIYEHLSRLRHADIFLDAFNVNGHTTVSDALFAGLPVVTKPGRQFASRVGASLVSAANCSELICGSDQEYVDLAVRLASDRAYREAIQKKLTKVTSSPLYDSALYTRGLEHLFECAVKRLRDGHPPEDLYVDCDAEVHAKKNI